LLKPKLQCLTPQTKHFYFIIFFTINITVISPKSKAIQTIIGKQFLVKKRKPGSEAKLRRPGYCYFLNNTG
jgi:hypothetical protein